MKRFVLFIFLLFYFSASFALDYYSQALQTDPNALGSWNTIPAGGGAVPASFTNAGDRFYIQGGHSMTTTAIWAIGSGASFLIIQNGATLQGDHLIQFDGTFQIDNGGTYIHNNNGSVAQPAGSSIFGGTESFGASSNFEIRNWQSNINGLPNTAPGIAWGNLIINLQVDLGGVWNWNIADGANLNVLGNLDIRQTYGGSTAHELRFTGTGIQTINVGGSFLLSGTKTQVAMKNRSMPTVDGYTTMQVDGNVSLTGTAILDLGINTTSTTAFGLYELRFRGNFSAAAGTTVTSTSNTPYLVANGVASQILNCSSLMTCSFRVAPGATVNLAASFTTSGVLKIFAILGTFNQNGFTMVMNGVVEAAGGTFNASGSMALGVGCRACSNDGTYNTVSGSWCTANVAKGRINFTGSGVLLDNNVSTTFISAGHLSVSSPGDVYFVNSTAGTIGGALGAGYILRPGSVFSLDGTSYVGGANSSYLGQGGLLRMGSANGIMLAPVASGNVRSQNRTYNASGTNDFEYFGTIPQATGDGLPTTIAGTLNINSTAGIGTTGVTLSQLTTVNGGLILTAGKLTTAAASTIQLGSAATLTAAYTDVSFVNGPMNKYGSSSFMFPIGKGVTIHPAEFITVNGSTGDWARAEYFNNDPGNLCLPNTPAGTIHHISGLEYWSLGLASMASPSTQISLYATTYSQATNRDRLVITRCQNGTGWVDMGNANLSLLGASGPVTSLATMDNGFMQSNFTLASLDPIPINPLPIDLISFDAIKQNSTRSQLNWELAACCSPVAKFEIQRAHADRKFSTITTVNGQATSVLYNYTDNDLKNGINYYRLKMTDADGTVTYSRTVAIMNGVDGLLLTSLFPTIVSSSATLTVTASKEQKLDIIIIDMQGRVVGRQNYTVSEDNSNIQLSTESLPAGAYQLVGISAAGKTNMIRFIKQ
ncbi:MAG TPA: T9SS type A sorting domain-containing protein [Chitinophagaceae bacterium]